MNPIPPEVREKGVCGICFRKISREKVYGASWEHDEPPDPDCEEPNHKATPIGG